MTLTRKAADLLVKNLTDLLRETAETSLKLICLEQVIAEEEPDLFHIYKQRMEKLRQVPTPALSPAEVERFRDLLMKE